MKSLAMMRNVLRRILHDVRTLALIVILPLFFVLLYGNSFSGSYRDLTIIIVNQDNGLASVRTSEIGRITLEVHLAGRFIDELDPQMFKVEMSDDPAAATEAVGESGVWAALVLPKSFSNTVVNTALRASGERKVDSEGETVTLLPSESTDGPKTTLTLDDANPMAAAAISGALESAFSQMLETQQSSITPEELLDLNTLYGGKIKILDFTAPGIIGFAMTLITVLLTAMSVVRERTSGTLTRILIAPISAWQVTVGYTLAFSLIAIFQSAELFLASTLLFHIRFVGSVALVAFIIILFTIGLQGIATLISTIARNEAQAMQFVLFLLIPSIMISGVFWPIEMMPEAIRPLSYVSPLTYANTGLRKVMLAGRGIGDIAFELAVLGAFALFMLLLSVMSMRRQAYTA
jgi:ABC-2 type transport system permease protein